MRDLQREVEGVKSIMSQNVERILARGENLEHLRNKTEDLEATVRGHCGDTGDIAGTRGCGSRGGFQGPCLAPGWHRDPGWGWARGTWGIPGVAPRPQGSPRCGAPGPQGGTGSRRWHCVPRGPQGGTKVSKGSRLCLGQLGPEGGTRSPDVGHEVLKVALGPHGIPKCVGPGPQGDTGSPRGP